MAGYVSEISYSATYFQYQILAFKTYRFLKTNRVKAGFHLSAIFSEFVSDWVSEFAKRVSTGRNSQQIPEWNRDSNGWCALIG